MENLLIAKVSKPQGIKGELKCQLYTDVFDAVKAAKRVFIDGESCEVDSAKIKQGVLYLKLHGVNDRNHAELFRNCEVYLPKQELRQFLNEDFLVDDLIGMVLYDEQGKLVGQIVDYEDYGSAAILSVDENGHIYEVPYVSSIFTTSENALVVNRKEYEGSKI